MSSRPGMVFGPGEVRVEGEMLQSGQPAPDFRLIANDFTTKTLADYAGRVKIISTVPSLGTRVCSRQTRTFNQLASELSDEVVILTVSADLPLAQSAWCGAEGVDQVVTLSDHQTMQFAQAYGVNVVDLRFCERAVFVLDQDNIVRYAEYVAQIGSEPQYEPALAAARSLVKQG